MNNRKSHGRTDRASARRRALLLGATVMASTPGLAEVELTTLAVTGDPAPGTGAAFAEFANEPTLNDDGTIAFAGSAIDAFTVGIWYGTPDNLTLVAFEGDPVPDIPGAVYSFFSEEQDNLVLTGDGTLLWSARASGGGTDASNNFITWAGTPGAMTAFMRTGGPAPQTNGAVYVDPDGPGSVGTFYDVRILNGSTLAFMGNTDVRFNGVADYAALWGGAPGGIVLRARSGEVTPEGMISQLSPGRIGLASDGTVYFQGGTGSIQRSIWSVAPGGAPQILHGQGGLAPGVPGGTFTTEIGKAFNGPKFFQPNLLYFGMGLELGGPITADNDLVYYAGPPGSETLLAREGDSAPGAPGAELRNLSDPLFNRNGAFVTRAFFKTGIGGTTPDALYFGAPGATFSTATLVARNGEPVPGLNDGTVFDGVFSERTTAINDNEVIVFWSRLAGPNITTANDHALFVYYGRTGEMEIIVREGQTVLAGCCLRYPLDIDFRGGDGPAGGRSSGLNNHDQVIFRLAHSGGRSLVLAQLNSGAMMEPVSYTDWATMEGLTEENNKIGDDPNEDGISNVEAYVRGIPAKGPTTPDNYITMIDESGNALIRFEGPANVTGVTVGSQVSTDLRPQSWSPGPDAVVVETTPDTRTYEISAPRTGPTTFLRLVFDAE